MEELIKKAAGWKMLKCPDGDARHCIQHLKKAVNLQLLADPGSKAGYGDALMWLILAAREAKINVRQLRDEAVKVVITKQKDLAEQQAKVEKAQKAREAVEKAKKMEDEKLANKAADVLVRRAKVRSKAK